jgi:hypothetical protein
MTGNTELASQFDSFIRRMLDPHAEAAAVPARRSTLGLQRLASIW